MRTLCGIGLLLLLSPAWAQTMLSPLEEGSGNFPAVSEKHGPPGPEPKPAAQNKSIPILDDTHELVSDRLARLANQLDSFFGDKRADDELNRSSIRVNYSYRLRMERAPERDFQFRFNLRLPNLEEKFKFSIQKNEKESSSGNDQPKTQAEIDTDERQARKKKEEQEEEPWRFRVDAGINVAVPPVVFGRGRLRKNWRFPIIIQRFTEEFAWLSDRGFLQTTTLFHDYALNQTQLARFVNEQNWLISGQEFTTSHGPSLIHTLSDDDALSYNTRMRSRVDGPWYVDNYSIGVSYRRNLRGQWLYGEIGPAIDFPKAESFRRMPSILLRIESLFGAR